MARPKAVVKQTYLHEYTDQFHQRCIEVARQITDWSKVLEHFNIPFQRMPERTTYWIGCPKCRGTKSIHFFVDKNPYPRWRCGSMCQCDYNDSFIGLLHLYNDKRSSEKSSPIQLLDEVEMLFASPTKKVAPVKKAKPAKVAPKKTAKAPKTRQTTRPKVTRYADLSGCLFPCTAN